MKNIKTIISTMLILALFASVSFAAKPVRIIVTGTLYQLDIPYTGKLDQNAKIYLGNFSSPLTWSQSGKGADVFVDLPEGISAGTYVLKMAGQKREIAIGPFIAETGLTNSVNNEVTRANTAEAGLTNLITTLSNSTFKAFMSYKAADESSISTTNDFVFPNVSTTDGLTTWTTNGGASFVIPTTGAYQVGFQVDLKSNTNSTSPYEIHVNRNDGSSTFSVYSCYYYEAGSHAGQVVLPLNAGDIITLQNSSEVRNMEIWSSTFYIIQLNSLIIPELN